MVLSRARHHFKWGTGFRRSWIWGLPLLLSLRRSLESEYRLVRLHQQRSTGILHVAPEQDFQNPKIPLRSASAAFNLQLWSWGWVVRLWGWRMWCLAISSCCTRFSCPLVESPLPGKPSKGTKKLLEYNSSHMIFLFNKVTIWSFCIHWECGLSTCVEVCSIRV